jgi:hypothetical protein
LKAKVPVHIIRYEDILIRPVEVMTDLLKFIMNVVSIEDTILKGYIDLATQEPSP